MLYIDKLRFWGGWWIKLTHKTVIVNKNKLPVDKVIFCANHTSNWDAVTFLANTKYAPIFVYKKEFVKKTAFKKMLDKLGYIAVDRGEADIGAIKKSLTALKNGNSMFIFPEGTRNFDSSELLPFKEGAVMLSIMTKTPICPMYFWHKKNKKGKVKGLTYIVVGDLISFDKYYGQKPTHESLCDATETIKKAITELKEYFERDFLPKIK